MSLCCRAPMNPTCFFASAAQIKPATSPPEAEETGCGSEMHLGSCSQVTVPACRAAPCNHGYPRASAGVAPKGIRCASPAPGAARASSSGSEVHFGSCSFDASRQFPRPSRRVFFRVSPTAASSVGSSHFSLWTNQRGGSPPAIARHRQRVCRVAKVGKGHPGRAADEI